jgi:hypothetical protein
MKQIFFYFLLPLILCCCVEPTFFPPEIVSAEYVNENSCKIGYRGDFSHYKSLEWPNSPTSGGKYDFFMERIAWNSDHSNSYSCREFEYIDKHPWSWTKTYYVLWHADENWDRGKTVFFDTGVGFNNYTGFQVPQ